MTGFYAAVLVAGLAVPLLGIYPVYLMTLYCFAMFACAFNLLLGFGGMLSFGHAAYFGFMGNGVSQRHCGRMVGVSSTPVSTLSYLPIAIH
jgi:ABC-type branched-subunit amino acid transport system permease subunit